MSDFPQNDRANEVLRVLVDRYIRQGQPVGSKTILEQGTLSYSSATIRNILSDLEDAGFVQSPHTSAGRVPTVKGYRFYVNHMLKTAFDPKLDVSEYAAQVSEQKGAQGVLQSASSIVSSMTELAGIVSVPKRQHLVLRHLEFLPLSDNRVLVILVFNEQEVQNRVIQTDRPYTESELQEAANFVLSYYLGKSLDAIRQHILQDMSDDQQSMSDWMQTAMQITQEALAEDPDQEDYVLSGEANLLAADDDLSRMRALFDAFAQKRSILHLLDQCLGTDGIQIYIGQESGVEVLDGYSLVTAPYAAKGSIIGVLGVIGPTRMDYGRAIAAVNVTANLITSALK